MLPQPFADKGANAPLFQNFARYASALVVLAGSLIIASWYERWQSILQMLPNTAPMQYNTALCFILSGAGLFLLTTPRAKIGSWLSGLVAALTLLTLLEYLTGREFGVDQLFFTPYLTVKTSYTGRMAPLSAVCFILISIGIMLVRPEERSRNRLRAAGMLGCAVAVVALVALNGFIFGIETATGWGAYSRIAVNTCILFLALSLGLLAWSWQMARRENFNFLRWLPVTASAMLMLMIAFVSATTMAELKNATFWRKHTVQVILLAQTFEENLIDIQRGARGYVTLGDTNALASHSKSARLEPKQFRQLAELTSDNPAQQQRLEELAKAIDRVFSYDQRVIALYNQQGSKAVFEMDATGEGRIVFGNARDLVRWFSQEERRLLETRGASEQTDSDSAIRLLGFGSLLAAGLLVLANFMASREVKRRLQSEEALLNSQMRMRLATETAGVAVWDWDTRSGALHWDNQMFTIYGMPPTSQGTMNYEDWRVRVLPEDLAEQEERLQRTIATCGHSQREFRIVRASDRSVRFIQTAEIAVAGPDGKTARMVGINVDVTDRKQNESEREKLFAELQQAFAEVKTLSGMIPICAWCKNLRNDQGYWSTVEQYVSKHTSATFTHGMCPACSAKYEAETARITA